MQINIKQIERVAKWGFASLFFIGGILFLLFLSSEWWCPEFWGSHNVGKNLYLLHWERDTYLFVYSTDVHGKHVIMAHQLFLHTRMMDMPILL